MRFLNFVALALLVTPASLFSQGPNADSSKTETKVIRQIEDSLIDGKTNNADALERVLADDYVNLVARGIGPSKSEIIANIRQHAGQSLPYTTDVEDMHIYILGDTAVAAFTKVYTTKENGNIAREDNTHIFRKDQGVWKLKISRATLRGSDME
jgi:hypothetical protein